MSLLRPSQLGYECTSCQSPTAYLLCDEARGDYVCNECGVCSEPVLSSALERMGSKFEDSPAGANSRAGGGGDDPTLFEDMGITVSGKPGTGRWSRAQGWSSKNAAGDRKQKITNAIIRRICDRLMLPMSVVLNAKKVSVLARTAGTKAGLENSQVHRPGWQRSGPLAAASVKLACKALGITREFTAICANAELDSCRLAWKAHNILAQQSASGARRVVVNGQPVAGDPQTLATAAAIGARSDDLRARGRTAATQLDLTYKTGGLVADLVDRANREQILVGTRPKTIAAAAAWLIGTKTGEINLSKRQASARCGLSEGALRRAATHLEPLMGEMAVVKQESAAPVFAVPAAVSRPVLAAGQRASLAAAAAAAVKAEPCSVGSAWSVPAEPPRVAQRTFLDASAASGWASSSAAAPVSSASLDIDMDALLGTDL